MINFKEHDGLLFKMLDKPVPLTDDAELPVLVRMIQDNTMLGKANKSIYHPDKLAQRKICSKLTDDGLFLDRIYAYRYEIIGTLVEEGSKEWALYQMMQGKWVYNPYLEKHKSDKIDTRCLHAYSKFGQDVVVKNILTGVESILGAANISHWTNYAEPTGWQIYEEPKPLLADAKVGDLVKLRNGSYSQIVEVKDGSVFKYQNPEVIGSVALFWCDENGDTSRWGKVKDFDIIFTEPLAPKGTKEWALQMMRLGNKVRNRDWDGGTYEKSLLYCQLIGETIKYNEGCSAFDVCLSDWEAPYIKNTGWQIYEPKPESQYKVGDWVEHKESKEQATIRRIMSYGAIEIEFAYSTESDIYQANDFHNDFRKLSPSEVVIRIGCLSGTIAKSSDPNYFLMLHSRPVTDCNHSIIRFSAIDPETRELVESLLEAQEDK